MGTTQQGRFEGGCARGDHTSIGSMQQVMGVAINQGNRQCLSTIRLLQIGAIDGGRLQ